MNRWLLGVVVAMFVVYIQTCSVNGSEPQVPCFFIFGDSLADNGNNNLLPTLAKVNYPPYGIDFHLALPTGRFSNGRTTVDIIGELLGFQNFIPPFATALGPEILKGVNYASGSAGIRTESGQALGTHLSMDIQLNNHQLTIKRIINLLGHDPSSAQKHLNKCLYSVGMGSNDYLNNYFLPKYYSTSRNFTVDQYANVLIEEYSQQIKTLYTYGARKIVLNGIGPIGCTPFAILTYGTKGSLCVDYINNAVQIFNKMLKSLVDTLNTNFIDAKFIYIDYFGIASGNSLAAGIKVSNVGCCPVNNIGQCHTLGVPCPNRNEYAFWDGFHPTEAINLITAQRSYKANDNASVHPFDISHLVQL